MNMKTDLDKAIEAAVERSKGDWTRDDLENIIREVVTNIEGDIDSVHVKLFQQIESLAKTISQTKKELASIRPDEIRSKHLPQASDELDAIVGATEEATGTIMDSCEAIEEMASGIGGETAEKLVEAVTKIYEACSFQDITGQRVSKVVKALKEVEEKVERILNAFGDEYKDLVQSEPQQDTAPKELTEEDLLNGPQLDHEANDKDEIDRLFNS